MTESENESDFLRKRVKDRRRAVGCFPSKETGSINSALNAAMRDIIPDYSVAEKRLKTEWIEIVGPDIAKRAIPGEIANKILTIRVAGAVWLAELKNNRASDLLRIVNACLGNGAIKRIDFRLAPTIPGETEIKRAPAPIKFTTPLSLPIHR